MMYFLNVLFNLQSVIRRIENSSTDGRDRPTSDVEIVDCGAEAVAEPFAVAKEDATE